MQKWLLIALILLLAACSPESAPVVFPEQATATAVTAAKSTLAAGLTAYPIAPNASQIVPTLDWTHWTPAPGEIVAADSGQTFQIGVTARISVVLDAAHYPPANLELRCLPADTLGRISNVGSVPPDYYELRYEGVREGQCSLQNGDFAITIEVIQRP